MTVVPSGTQSGGILNSIAAVAPDDLWAVGETNGEALAIHYTKACARD